MDGSIENLSVYWYKWRVRTSGFVLLRKWKDTFDSFNSYRSIMNLYVSAESECYSRLFKGMPYSLKQFLAGFISCLFFLMLSGSLQAQVQVDILVVGAGGSGGAHKLATNGSGGGGGGGVAFVEQTTLADGSYTVTVAPTTSGKNNGSTTCNGVGNNGQNSVFSRSGHISITAYGGGGGGGCGTANGNSGGSSGGGHCTGTGQAATKAVVSGQNGGNVTVYGNQGGTGSACGSPSNGAGGGGATAVGSVSNGGAGVSLSITGTAQVYGSGGGANAVTGGFGGTNAGNGTSGTNTNSASGSVNAANNFGGGGGGSSCGNCTSGSGGSGVVIIRYAATSPLATGGSQTSYTGNGTNGTNGVVYQVHTFTSSGTFALTGIITTQPSALAQQICLHGASTPLSVVASGTSLSYQWYSNTIASNTGGTLISGAISASYTPPTQTAGTLYYYCVVTNSSGTQTSQVSGAITVSTSSVAGSISGATAVMGGTNSTLLTLSGFSGSIQWQSSSDGTQFSDLVGATTTTYTATDLNATTYFRAVVTNGGCAAAISPAVTILVTPAPSAATTLTISGTGGQISIVNNVPTIVDAGLLVTGDGQIHGFSVSISGNYTPGDLLDYTGALPSGVTAAPFNVTSRSIVFTGSASPADWQTLLRTVRLITAAVTCNPETREVTFSTSTNYFNYFNGHYYEYSPVVRSWTDAKAFAASKTFFGRRGYLVTISSAAENAFVSTLINQDTWIGCSDNFSQINGAVGYTKYASQNNAEGRWHWITGPEKGIQIRTGNASTAEKPGSPVSGVFQNWNITGSYSTNEPNDVWSKGLPGEEDYGHLWANSSKWNDFPNRGRACIIEYGDMPGDQPVGSLSFSRSVLVLGATPGSISGGNLTVCSGGDATLQLDGATGTVARWEAASDPFFQVGATQSLANTTTTLALTNLTATHYYRAIMVNGACTLATNHQRIEVADVFPGTITAYSNQVCSQSAAELSLNGYVGTVQKWQVSTDTTGASSDIASTASTLSQVLSTTGTHFFRALVENAGCGTPALATEWYPVEVSGAGAPAGGTLNSNYHCGVNNEGVLELSGATGSSFQWETSIDGGNNWTNISGATQPTYAYQNLTTNRKFRVQVSSGACGSATSSVGVVELYGTNVCQWTGVLNNNWNDPGNWCGGIVAENGRDMALSPTTIYAPLLDMNRTVGVLSFRSGAHKILLGAYDLTVSQIQGFDSLNFVKTDGAGKLKALISGNLGSFTFPVGKSTYNPVTITNRNAQDDVFSVRVMDEVRSGGTSGTPIQTPHVQRTWDIDKTNPVNASGVDFSFGWHLNQEMGTMSGFYLNHYLAGVGWELPPVSSIDPSNLMSDTIKEIPFYSYTGTFSPFAIGGDDVSPLPVDWLNFDLDCVGQTTRLSWQTASEQNNQYFEIQYSTDLENWHPVARIPAKGQSNQLETYVYYLSNQSLIGPYFQLSQVDVDGKKDVFGVRYFAELCSANQESAHLFPNPSAGHATLIGSPPFAQWELMDGRGTKLTQFSADEQGRMDITLSAPPGIYFLKSISFPGLSAIKWIKY